MLVEIVGINVVFFCGFFWLFSKEVQGFSHQKTLLCQSAARKQGGDYLFRSVCDPEVLQAADNEKDQHSDYKLQGSRDPF